MPDKVAFPVKSRVGPIPVTLSGEGLYDQHFWLRYGGFLLTASTSARPFFSIEADADEDIVKLTLLQKLLLERLGIRAVLRGGNGIPALDWHTDPPVGNTFVMVVEFIDRTAPLVDWEL